MAEIIRHRLRLASRKHERLENLPPAIGLPRAKACTRCLDGTSYC